MTQRRSTRKPLSIWEKMYIPAVVKGMLTTASHIPKKKFTLLYPEIQPERPPRYRGVHRLTKDEHGNMKCVACFMCATACPAHCITIKAGPAPDGWLDRNGRQREKIAEVFEINMLRCIFCGYCVEACPEEAIAMTGKTYPQSGYPMRRREDFIFDRERLLSI